MTVDCGVVRWRRTQPQFSHVGFSPFIFTPASVSPSLWLDPSNLTTLFQDSGGTGAVTANNDPVGYVGDLSGGANNFIQATAGARPLYNTASTLRWLTFDGTDDVVESVTNMSNWMSASVLDILFAVNAVSIGTDSGAGYLNDAVFTDKTNGEIGLCLRTTSSSGLTAWGYDGGFKYAPDTYAAGTKAVMHMRHTGGNVSLTINNNTTVTTALGNSPVTSTAVHWYLAASYSLVVYSNIELYGVIARTTIFTALELAQLKTWLGAKMGIVV